MSTFETIVEQKSDKELFDIYIKSQDYQPEFIKAVEAELTNRNIPLDSVKKIKEEADTISNNKIKLGVQGNTFYIALLFLICNIRRSYFYCCRIYLRLFKKRKLERRYLLLL